VENLCSAAEAEGASVASVGGLAGGLLLATGQPSGAPPAPVCHYFTINHRKYDEGSATDGTVEGWCYTFGIVPSGANGPARQTLDIYFTLRDGTSLEAISRDVTGCITRDEQAIQLCLRVEAGGRILGPEDVIRLPDTPDPGGDGSAIDAKVNEWGQELNIPLDI